MTLMDTIRTKVHSWYYTAQGSKIRGSQIKSWPHPHSKFQASLRYRGRPWLDASTHQKRLRWAHRHSRHNWTSVILKAEVQRGLVPSCSSFSMETSFPLHLVFPPASHRGQYHWLDRLKVGPFLCTPLLYLRCTLRLASASPNPQPLFSFLPLPLSLHHHSHQPPPWQLPLSSHLSSFYLACLPFLYLNIPIHTFCETVFHM